MFTHFNSFRPSSVLPANRQPRSVSGIVALFVCLSIAIPAAFSAPASTLGEEQSGLLADDGFTRETLTDFNAPEPAPFAAVPAASVEAMHRRHYAKAAARHRRQLRSERAAQNSSPVIVVKSAARRNPLQSFVYWWNGWVINTFHTKVGTVMLGTIGAKT